MHPKDVLAHPSVRLTDAQRTQYFEQGFVGIESAIPDAWIERLRTATAEMVERSRRHAESDHVYVLEEGHSAATPRLHRLYSPEVHHPDFWAFLCSDEMTELAADVVGPSVKFHHAKLNFKSARGSRGFKWHQDIQAWPHTDYSPVTIGVYLEGCGPEQGPLSMIPGTHAGPLYTMYDESGSFAVALRDDDLASLGEYTVASPVGPPGTVVLLNCRTVHGSAANASQNDRPLLLAVYSSADSYPYTSAPIASECMGAIVRGDPARYACFDTRPCELPPDWARVDYGGPWRRQQSAESSAAGKRG